MAVVTAINGALASTLSWLATRGSLDRVEMATPAQIDRAATSGVKSTWASSSGPLRSADATGGCAKRSMAATKAPRTPYETASDGRSTASALPRRNSSARIGVVSTGSSVPCCRSPATE
jgi:hypothetical protein